MPLIYGKKGCKYTHQEEFPETIECDHVLSETWNSKELCKGKARISFVYHEKDDSPSYLYNMRNSDDKLWLHDACSVAVYFCSECLKAQVLWNQA